MRGWMASDPDGSELLRVIDGLRWLVANPSRLVETLRDAPAGELLARLVNLAAVYAPLLAADPPSWRPAASPREPITATWWLN